MHEKVAKTPKQALNSLMALCARAEKSSGDAVRLMFQWGVDPAKHREVLDRLIQDKFIDDRRYAAAYIREKSRLNGWGYFKIKSNLQLKGIDRSIIDEQLLTLDRESTRKRLGIIIQKKKDALNESDKYKLKGKLVRYALGMGYEYDSVISAVEDMFQDDDF